MKQQNDTLPHVPRPQLFNAQVFKRSVLKEMAQKNGFLKHHHDLENDHCDSDLLYALFKRPRTVTQKLLSGFVEIIKKKNAPDLERSRMFCDAISFLLENPRTDERVKVFYILWIISAEPDTKEVIVAGHVKDHKGDLWGDKYNMHFEIFLQNLKQLVAETKYCPFGQTESVNMVHRFILCAERIYFTK